jgi:excisionase family DNA binding protein
MPDVGSNAEMLSLEDVAERLNVHYMTAYRYVRLGRLKAEQVAGRWFVSEHDLTALSEQPRPTPGRGKQAGRYAAPTRRLTDRLLAGDGSACWSIVEETLGQGGSATDVYLKMLGPAMRDIGAQWANGTATVEAEHRATAVAVRIVGRLGPSFARRGTPVAGTIILGGAPGDSHLIPVAIVSDVLRNNGLKVLDLGADAPETSFLEAARTTPDLHAVGISVSDRRCLPGAKKVFRTLSRLDPSPFLLAGGPALQTREDARLIGADDWASNALEAAQLLRNSIATQGRR